MADEPYLLTPAQAGTLTDGPILGRGAFGVVRLCLSSTLGLLAVKQVPVSSASELAAAHREAVALRVCRSPSFVVDFKGMLLTEPSLSSPVPHALLFLEHIPGGTLAALAAGWGAEVRRGRGLPEGVLHLYARGIVAAVAHMHAIPVAHRDIKGANLLLTGGGGVKLADFGSAKVLLAEDAAAHYSAAAAAGSGGGGGGGGGGGSPSGRARPRTAAAALFGKAQADGGEGGTVAWMAPEVVGRGGSPLASADAEGGEEDAAAFWLKADMWSLGCTLLELLTGHHPWRGVAEDAGEVMLSIVSCDLRERVPAWASPALRALICACLHPAPAQRPSAAELLAGSPFLAEGYAAEAAAAAAAARGAKDGEGGLEGGGEGAGGAARGRAARAKAPAAGGAGGGGFSLPSFGGVPAFAVSRALVNCDRLRSEVRLACRHVQRWFTAGARGEAPAATGWVGSCVFSEERLPLAPFKEDFVALCGAFGPRAAAAVAEACDSAAPLCTHRGCSASVLFGDGGGGGGGGALEWSAQVETQLLLGAVAAGPHVGDFGVIALLLRVLAARVDAWGPAGVPLAGAATVAAAPSGLGAPSLCGIAVALQWLATARAALAQREADAAEAAERGEEPAGEDEGGGGGGGGGAAHAETVPDFAVLFFARIAVWMGELTVALRTLAACEAAWEGAVAAAPPAVLRDMDAAALAQLLPRLLRKAYARLLGCVRSWEQNKSAVFAERGSPRKAA
jgi:serine/threonine protein kinase